MCRNRRNILCTVVVCSCDKYSDLWEPFFTLFHAYWPECPYPVVLNTESKVYARNDMEIRVFSPYKERETVPYGKRMKDCLLSVETPYVLLMLDDFFLRENVHQERLDRMIEWMEKNPDVSCFNFDCIKDTYDIEDGRFEGFKRRSRYGEYRYNMQAGIWRTKTLMNAWKEFESPWQWEVFGNMRSWKNNYVIYSLKSNADTPMNYGFNSEGMGVFRGKWVIDDVAPLFAKHGIAVDFSKRGEYKESDNSVENSRDNYAKILKSAGFMRMLSYVFWAIEVHLKRWTKKETMSYSTSLNERYYSKERTKIRN